MKVNIELPFFPGFYESSLFNSDTPYWAIKEELEYMQEEHPELTENDLDFDYRSCEDDLMHDFVDIWNYHAPKNVVVGVSNPELVSPKYYNFSNDRIFVDVELTDNWQDEMRHFIALNYDWLKERIHDDWTSYDGFHSFMSNDVDEWSTYLFEEMDDRYISTMIGYMMYQENKEIRDTLVMDTLEDFYEGQYVFLTEEGKAKVKKSEEAYDPNQLTIPFED